MKVLFRVKTNFIWEKKARDAPNKKNADENPSLFFMKKVKIDVTLNNQSLKEVDNAKYLGILIDNKLNWLPQINAIKLKISKGRPLEILTSC